MILNNGFTLYVWTSGWVPSNEVLPGPYTKKSIAFQLLSMYVSKSSCTCANSTCLRATYLGLSRRLIIKEYASLRIKLPECAPTKYLSKGSWTNWSAYFYLYVLLSHRAIPLCLTRSSNMKRDSVCRSSSGIVFHHYITIAERCPNYTLLCPMALLYFHCNSRAAWPSFPKKKH